MNTNARPGVYFSHRKGRAWARCLNTKAGPIREGIGPGWYMRIVFYSNYLRRNIRAKYHGELEHESNADELGNNCRAAETAEQFVVFLVGWSMDEPARSADRAVQPGPESPDAHAQQLCGSSSVPVGHFECARNEDLLRGLHVQGREHNRAGWNAPNVVAR